MRLRSISQRTTFLLAASSLAIILAAESRAARADTITGFVFNNESYTQTSNAAPTSPTGYFFSIGATFTTPGSFTSASAAYPGPGSPLDLPPLSSTDFNYNSAQYATLTALHNDFPFGTYTITTVPTETSAISYTSDNFTTTIPYLTNLNSLSASNPTQPFTVDFNSFTKLPDASEGFTFFSIYDLTTSTPVLNDGFLDPSTVSALIPANTLVAGNQYAFELDFSNRFDFGLDPNNLTFSTLGFDVRTDGTFTLSPGVPEPSTWVMMLIGFAGLGFAGYSRSKKTLGAISA